MDFSEENIASIFGHEAAENEDIIKLREYYFKSNIYSQVSNTLPIRILVGHKGIGKSALFSVSIDEDSQNGRLSVLIKPDDIIGIGEDIEDFLKLIREWKSGIIKIISEKILKSYNLYNDGWERNLASMGGKVIAFLQASLKAPESLNLQPTQKAIIQDFLNNGKIYVYIDDLDRGWQGRKRDIIKISALLNAIRDITTENTGVCFRISLRSDVYYLVRTSDESTDKIEGSVVWYSWTNHEILAMLVKRIQQYVGKSRSAEELMQLNQNILASYLDEVISPTFNGRGKWENIPTYRMLMSLIRKRPRDLVKLCTLAAKKARSKKSNIIGTNEFSEIFEEYSQGRLQDTINEYRSELPDIERLLLGMKPSKREKKASESYVYTSDSLIRKLKDIQQTGRFKFAKGEVADERSLAAFMYKINFLTARKDKDTFIERKYFEESRYLSNTFVDFGFDWEIHPAYRWALQPESIEDIFLQMKPSAE